VHKKRSSHLPVRQLLQCEILYGWMPINVAPLGRMCPDREEDGTVEKRFSPLWKNFALPTYARPGKSGTSHAGCGTESGTLVHADSVASLLA
jgi:hypothetical protein